MPTSFDIFYDIRFTLCPLFFIHIVRKIDLEKYHALSQSTNWEEERKNEGFVRKETHAQILNSWHCQINIIIIKKDRLPCHFFEKKEEANATCLAIFRYCWYFRVYVCQIGTFDHIPNECRLERACFDWKQRGSLILHLEIWEVSVELGPEACFCTEKFLNCRPDH